MRKNPKFLLLKKVTFFILPFIAYVAIEIIIDPYNFFSYEKNPKLLIIKKKISYKLNNYLYSLIEYDRSPTAIIILGESQAQELYPVFIETIIKDKVSNLSGGGGSLVDVIKIFWEIAKKKIAEKVYIGVSIETYSGTLLKDRATTSINIKNSLIFYLLNRYTFESTLLIAKAKLFNEHIDIDKPPFSRNDFWKYQLQNENRYLKNYSYPKNYHDQLKKISEYCIENNIKLFFFISPTHIDLQNKIDEFNMRKEYEVFRNDITSFGDLYDFNFPNELSRNKSNFSDPYHTTDSISSIVAKEIFLNKPIYSKLIRKRNFNN